MVSVVAFILSCVAITLTFITKSDGKNGDLEKRMHNIEEKLKSTSHPPTIIEIDPVDAFQMSNYRAWLQDNPNAADRAIDGAEYTFQSTEKEVNPWWCADMGAIYHVKRVIVTNRRENQTEHMHVHDRAKNLRVGVTDMRPEVGESLALDAYTLCEEKHGLMGAVGIVNCPDDVSGQYLIVQFRTENWMHVAEVEIYGVKDKL